MTPAKAILLYLVLLGAVLAADMHWKGGKRKNGERVPRWLARAVVVVYFPSVWVAMWFLLVILDIGRAIHDATEEAVDTLRSAWEDA